MPDFAKDWRFFEESSMSINEYLAQVRRALDRLDVYGFAESIVFQ